MNLPLTLYFNYDQNKVLKEGEASIPKIFQGAPYEQTLKLRDDTLGTYRDFSSIEEVRMQARLSAGSPLPLFEITKTLGNFVCTTDSITIQFDAATTQNIPVSNQLGVSKIQEVAFVFSIEFMVSGVVIERFAHGTGFMVLDVTR